MRIVWIIIGTVLLPAQFLTSQQLEIYTENGKDTYSVAEIDSITFDIPEYELPITVTDIDGNVYQAVTIGDQVWMSENLKVTRYRNGDSIPNVTDPEAWETLTTDACCEYSNDTNNMEIYGRLYNFYAVNDSRGIAPEGWHVATDEEWQTLEKFLGMDEVEAGLINERGTDEGGKLKQAGTEYWKSPNKGATNIWRFNGLPGGSRSENGEFVNLGYYADFWTATELPDINMAMRRNLAYHEAWIFRVGIPYNAGYSVRCIKD